MNLNSKQYYLDFRRVNIGIPSVLVILFTIVLQQYNCKQTHGVNGIGNISSNRSIGMNFTSHVPEPLSDAYSFPAVLNEPHIENVRLRPVNSTNKTEVPFMNYKNSTNRISAVVQQQHNPSNYSVMTLVRNIDIRLRSIRNIELGLATIQEIFDVIQFKAIVNKTNETLFHFSKRLSDKLKQASKSIFQMKRFFETNVTSILSLAESSRSKEIFLDTVILPCPLEDMNLEPNYNKQQIQILNYLKNNHRAKERNTSYSVNYKILDELQVLNIDTNNFKHIFYLSMFDHASDHNCLYHFNNMQFRQLYASAIQRKRIFILFDIGSALTVDQMEVSKAFVSNIIKMLDAKDMVSIVTLANEAFPMKLIDSNDADTNLSKMYFVGANAIQKK